uniref:Uncharacterized protein n=1 Tax=Arundo donax TaxID=35708 RepID=A0A0A9E177_ARUDO
MNYTRGYHSSAVLGGSIFTFGGVKGEANTILDVAECYKEGCGWVTTGLKSIGRRCYCSAIVLRLSRQYLDNIDNVTFLVSYLAPDNQVTSSKPIVKI